MHQLGQSELDYFSYNEKVNHFLQKVKSDLNLSLGELGDIALLGKKKIERCLSGSGSLPITSFQLITDRMNVGLSTILSNKVDYNALFMQFNGDRSFLPAKYRKVAFSRKRTVLNVLDHIRMVEGETARSSIMQEHQLTDEIFENPDSNVSHLLMMNLLDACNKRGYLKIDFFQMGRNSFKLNKGSFFHKQVAKQKNILHAHEYICEDIGPNFFDKNFHYRIKKLNAKKCVIGAKSRIEVAKALGVDQLGSDLDHATRSGVISTFSQYLGFSPSKVFTSFSGSDQQEVDFNIHFPIS